MEAKEFLDQLDKDAIIEAIRQAEQKTSGHIHVFISRKKPHDVIRTAQRRFVKLGLDDSKARNSVLLYFAPRSRKFAFLGDRAFSERCNEVFWRDLTGEVSSMFRKDEFTQGVLHAIHKIAPIYAEHFQVA